MTLASEADGNSTQLSGNLLCQFEISFGIDLRDVSRLMAADDLGCFQTETLSDFGRRRVSQSIGSPFLDVMLLAYPLNDSAIAVCRISLARLFFRL